MCRNYHFDNCQRGAQCNRKHWFIVGDKEAMRRVMFTRNPTGPVSRLTKLSEGGKDYFVLRDGREITVFEYVFEQNNFNKVYNWSMN